MSERDLVLLTGLPAADVASALDRLAQLGAIDFGGAPEADHGKAAYGKAAPRTEERGGDGAAPGGEHAPRTSGRSAFDAGSDSPPLYDPSELDEDVEIEPARKRRILDLFYRLEDLDHYEILGIKDPADKKQIKAAYYQLAPEFHPDTYFRKRLGSYKAKIEAVFTRITLAHDVLTSRQRRAEYDAYLETTHRNRSMAALLDQTPRDVASVVAAVDQSAQAAAAVEAPLRTGPRAPVAPSAGRYTSETKSAEEIARERRETLARKLRGGTSKPLAKASPPAEPRPKTPAETAAEHKRAQESLRARYEAALADAKRAQLQRYLDLGRAALDRKDFAAAANAYRIAASLAPDDKGVQTTCEDATRLASVALADGYWKQAQYEAGQERWAEAALSYAKVCAGKPNDARAHERVAFATLKSSGNSRRAVEFARRAIELAPESAELHVTLARAYGAAGLEKSAAAELERAVEIAPNDPRIRELVGQARSPSQKGGKVS